MRSTLFTILASVLLTSCDSVGNIESNNTENSLLSKSDSLELLDKLLDELKEEIYSTVFLTVDKDTLLTDWGCLPRYRFNIRMNERNEVMVENVLNGQITNSVIEYFTANIEKNYPDNNSPMYTRIAMDEIMNQIIEAEANAEKAENTEGLSPGKIDFKWKLVDEWEVKKKVLKVLGDEFLTEPHEQARIYLDYLPEISGQSSIIDSALLAFYHLRDRRSIFYFKESYLSIFQRYFNTKDEVERNKLLALKTLHPIRIIDIPNIRKHNLMFVDEHGNIVREDVKVKYHPICGN